ncbi:MAG: hypothetical protein SVM80_00940 [Halobacteriota archaeon]|nr:hypothetical protein [Halobacteriota archaeon]
MKGELKLVTKIVRYVCDICSSAFEKEEEAKDCEEQKLQPFKFDLKEEAIIKGKIFPEKVEIIERLWSKVGHQNIYVVKKVLGWGEEVQGEQRSIISEEDLIPIEEYEKKISDIY